MNLIIQSKTRQINKNGIKQQTKNKRGAKQNDNRTINIYSNFICNICVYVFQNDKK